MPSKMRAVALITAISLISAGAAAFAPELKAVRVSRFWVRAGGSVAGSVKLTQEVVQTKSPLPPLVVALKTTNTAAATVPATVSIAPGQDSVTFLLRGVSAGCGSVVASYNGKNVSADFVVDPPITTTSHVLTVPTSVMYQGAQYTGHFNLSSNPSGVNVILTSTNPIVTITPWGITIPAGQTHATFTLSSRGNGCATIIARIGQDVRLGKTVMIVPPQG